jgi:hypothetical protein
LKRKEEEYAGTLKRKEEEFASLLNKKERQMRLAQDNFDA